MKNKIFLIILISISFKTKAQETINNALIINGVDTGNPSAESEQTRISGYGILGNRSAMYISNEHTDGHLNFYVGGKHGTGSHMIIKNTGNIGIGTSNPTEKLVVNGKSKINNTLIINGVDTGNPSAELEQTRISGYGILGNRSAMYISNEHTDGHLNFYVGGKHGTGSHMIIKNTGNVGIGTTDTKGYKLGVNGKIAATEVKVALYNNWPDFVFNKSYNLPTLTEVENHIRKIGHLKDIPNAEEVKKNGIHLGEMDTKLLQKIEELTLYIIEQDKKIKELELLNLKITKIQKRLEKLETK